MQGIEHKPRWFKEVTDPITQQKEFYYLGGYWEEREKC
jgi:hypothetical protein